MSTRYLRLDCVYNLIPCVYGSVLTLLLKLIRVARHNPIQPLMTPTNLP